MPKEDAVITLRIVLAELGRFMQVRYEFVLQAKKQINRNYCRVFKNKERIRKIERDNLTNKS